MVWRKKMRRWKMSTKWWLTTWRISKNSKRRFRKRLWKQKEHTRKSRNFSSKHKRIKTKKSSSSYKWKILKRMHKSSWHKLSMNNRFKKSKLWTRPHYCKTHHQASLNMICLLIHLNSRRSKPKKTWNSWKRSSKPNWLYKKTDLEKPKSS